MVPASAAGRDPAPRLVEEESWKDFQVDIAFLFPIKIIATVPAGDRVYHPEREAGDYRKTA